MSSTTITPYLFFAGRCDEAIAFYRAALGAEVEMLMRYNEGPEPPPPGAIPPGFETKVMHATVRIGGVPLMMSDGNKAENQFQGFRLALALPSEAEAQRAFHALADGGSIQMPLGKTFWSPCFGMLTDRWGVGWMVSLATPPTT
jgi:PhnB protein